jgi:dolichyl-diphosphooligosaccharide--protein glycosyltransferase
MPFTATTTVTEGQVIGENESATTVTLEPAFEIQTDDTAESENGSTDDATAGDGDGTTTNETSGTDSSTNTSGSLSPVASESFAVAP